MQNKSKINFKQLLIVIVICVSIILINFFYARSYHAKVIHKEIRLKDGWMVSIKHPGMVEEVYCNLDISNTRFSMMNKGDVIVMRGKLPDTLPVHPTLNAYTIHSTINIDIDGEGVYSYGDELYKEGKLLGYGNHYVILDRAYAGKSIDITMEVTENEAFFSLSVPVLTCGDYLFRDSIIQNRTQIIITVFIILFGIVITVIPFIYAFKSRELLRLTSIGLFAFFIGIWFMCNSNIMQMFTTSMQLKTFLEYTSLYSAPTFLFHYFSGEYKKVGGMRYKLYLTLLTGQTVFMWGSLGLQLTNILHYPELLKWGHLLIFLMLIFLVHSYITGVIKGTVYNRPVVYGFMILASFVISDIIRFNYNKYSENSHSDSYVSFIHIGVLILLISLISDFVVSYVNGVYEQAERDTLEKMLYTDYLTGIYNRRYIEDVMDKLDEESSDYSLIAYDLNKLKQVNDTLGHDEGDRYIKEFAKAAARTFEGVGETARIGGDEFITILPHGKSIDKNKLLEKLIEEIAIINANNEQWNMSTAYGYCDCDDPGVVSIRDAAKLADDRMYANKKKQSLMI